MYRFAAALVLVAGLTSVVYAQGVVTVELSADPSELTVGDVVTLTLRVTHPESYRLLSPELPRAWGDLEVRGQGRQGVEDNGDGTQTTTEIIEVTLFSSGLFQTPALTVQLLNQDGQKLEEPAPRISLAVLSVLAVDDVDELRDIRPQAGLSLPALWPWVVAAVLLAVVAGVGGRALYRRLRADGRRLAAPLPIIETRSPYEVAMDEIARIEGLRLPEHRRFREYCTLVSEALRRYIDGVFRVPALDLTTGEVRLALRSTAIGVQHSGRALELLRECDLVKFARFVPDVPAARGLTGRVRSLVEETRPPEPDEASGRPVSSAQEAAT